MRGWPAQFSREERVIASPDDHHLEKKAKTESLSDNFVKVPMIEAVLP